MRRHDRVNHDYVLLLDTNCIHCEPCSLLSKQLPLLELVKQIPGQWRYQRKISLLLTLYMVTFYTSHTSHLLKKSLMENFTFCAAFN